ncbi:hypothetical protein LXM50_09720 [Microbacterium sp. Au-Mic1]|uniref:hypothetical protein n=1 Tax=Microbacterium sp. Au-Mic1 TaxID=2906457 RepID=UPI001E3B8BA7|nr:hypothetical protein [Microbacterium sp. Au-Mic1]MCE4026252.1 hypothetical protein [Microbacterium sp. Au-Mic1]
MQELAGRLTALDPEASESLKVISYFDSLVANGAGLEALVRAAAVLSGVASGAELSGRVLRVDATGRRSDAEPDTDSDWPSSQAGGPRVWIERHLPMHANDPMILDRLSLAVAIVSARRSMAEPSSIEVVLDSGRSPDERAAAVTRLRLTFPVRVIAIPVTAEGPPPVCPSAVITSPHGLVRAMLAPLSAGPPNGPAGHALAATAADLPQAWLDARIALRLTDARRPVVFADELGALIALARSFDPRQPRHPDVDTLLALDERTRALLDELVAADSVRSAAATLGLHHSSMQARHESTSRLLGYDPRSSLGRPRYEAARLLSRMV